jgi:fucose 4-O-acetylase-like acetyltransferase
MIRDKQVDIMLFLGILFVVIGHSYHMPNFFFAPYSFQISLFFFISGYLFRIRTKFADKLQFAIKKIWTQVVPYFIFNLLFFGFAYYLRSQNIEGLTNDFTFYNFFVDPFVTGHQNSFMIPLWFLLNLFIVNLLMQGIYLSESKIYKWFITLIVLVVSVFGIRAGLEMQTGIMLTLVRTSFALVFFQLGHLVNTYKNQFDKVVLNPIIVILLWSAVSLLESNFGNIYYSIVWGSIQNTMFYIPLLTSICIIFISYTLCEYLSRTIENDSFLVKIGRNSFWVMALHLFVFFLVNLGFYFFGLIKKSDLSEIYFIYNPIGNFLIYQIPALVIPVLIGESYKKLKKLFL